MRPRWVAAWVSTAVLLLAGCPRESVDKRNAVYSVEVEIDGMRSIIPYPQTLTIGPVDAEAMGAEESVIHTKFRSFVIRTDTVVRGTADIEYCLQDPIVIVDATTRAVDHTIRAGTCLSTKYELRIQLTKDPS